MNDRWHVLHDDGPRLQDFCGSDASGHLSQAIDPNVTGLILHALDESYAPTCTPFTLPL